MLKTWFAIPLWQRVIGALVLGIIVGFAWGPGAESIKIIGDVFIAFIKMLVVPLIFFSLVAGVAAIGDLRKLGNVGWRALLLFVVTGQIAVWLGLGLGTVFQPGIGLDTSAIEMGEVPEPAVTTWRDMVLGMVPQSPVQVMADVNVLPLIIFSLLIGIGILMAKEDGAPAQRIFDSGAVVMQKVTIVVMELTPFGVFALMAWVAGTLGVPALLALGQLVALVYGGCLLLILLMYAGIVKFLARLPVVDFFRGIVDAMAVAYSTASSNATLPVTMRCVERNLGVSRSVTSFTTSLGATINMDGTAMYLGLATLFGAQIFGVDLSTGDYVTIAVLATVGSIGAAGIPGAGLIMMAAIFTAVEVPLETIAFVAGVDRIMDMMRTATNVTGDATVATTVGVMTGEIDTAEMVSADDV
ncbi:MULTISPECIES: dicarboxylate/amino acid:cation symporter [unclassified Erythrobacter]|uniref:dicarboxylate/amino acid:cation symporter n=1 Tax=unclassified Erythrobacter TaxID=2633097 RepID=UPI00076BF566|nr:MULTISPECIES: dicarboxylate/amino acid:cation symporter [unclassified Erythrobacter]KWV93673.1 glutamate:proton symporter [Erythrobacter sp. AP23]MBO6526542.1 dicarboxylate/amino acid:cation symporter [Erythrobacter sp.]MBO6529246.1 dicarboxylate/amino acid:cation symporter [Erythrobacter sp.]MBO6767550.1 dicarboxylate/amino acid:cation symporter [Erythrobacter sp.]